MKSLLFIVFMIPIAAISQQPIDGPYVFEQGDSVQIVTIMQQEDLVLPAVQMMAKSDFSKQVISVPVVSHPAWSFTVSLQQQAVVLPSSYAAPEKLFVLSDIEGEFAAGRRLLIAAKVIDEQYNWTFGKGHLVIAGDLFDRGTDVLPWLWLLYSLEAKAKAAGGFVHVILGNHDVMQLAGDYRYTDAKYFKHAWLMNKPMKGVYGEESLLGQWLRSKNVVEKIGELLALHAGVSPKLLKEQLTIQQINDTCRMYYGKAKKDIPGNLLYLFDNRSPFWYRQYFTPPLAPMSQVDSTLDLYGVKQIIVGHTITDSIGYHYEGKVIAVDVDQHSGKHEGLLIEGQRFYRVDDEGTKIVLY